MRDCMWDYPLHFRNMKRKYKPIPYHVYIAHFAIRNNNNLFYRFSKIEAGGGPETKHFMDWPIEELLNTMKWFISSCQGMISQVDTIFSKLVKQIHPHSSIVTVSTS